MRFLVLLAAALLSGCSAAAAATINLGEDGYSLDIRENSVDGTVTVTLQQAGRLALQVTIGNAGIELEDVRKVRLCADCEESVFVPVFDLTSTYGATTGVLVWPSWNLTVLPMAVADVADVDGDGVFELIERLRNSDEPFTFQEGLILPGPSSSH